MPQEENMRVMVRVRPPSETPSDDDEESPLVIEEGRRVSVNRDSKGKASAQFSFSHVLGCESSQEELYAHCRDSANDVMDGINCCILAYGQTGSGKTYSMLGSGWEDDCGTDNVPGENEGAGIVPRCVNDIFALINKLREASSEGFDFLINCQFMQIYNERIYDLLQDKRRENPLQLRDSEKGCNSSVYVQGLSEYRVHCTEDVFALLAKGVRNRAVRSTDLNAESSRSHTLLQMFVQVHGVDTEGMATLKRATFSFVDLAGSEKWRPALSQQSTGGAADKQLREMTNINTSLHVLGNCVSALIEPGRRHIPYRDSLLTRLLQDSLGGGRTTLIATVRSDASMVDETYSTLQFAARASKIKTVLRPSKRLLSQGQGQGGEGMTLERAKKEIAVLRAQVQTLQQQVIAKPSPTPPPVDSPSNACPSCVHMREMLEQYEHQIREYEQELNIVRSTVGDGEDGDIISTPAPTPTPFSPAAPATKPKKKKKRVSGLANSSASRLPKGKTSDQKHQADKRRAASADRHSNSNAGSAVLPALKTRSAGALVSASTAKASLARGTKSKIKGILTQSPPHSHHSITQTHHSSAKGTDTEMQGQSKLQHHDPFQQPQQLNISNTHHQSQLSHNRDEYRNPQKSHNDRRQESNSLGTYMQPQGSQHSTAQQTQYNNGFQLNTPQQTQGAQHSLPQQFRYNDSLQRQQQETQRHISQQSHFNDTQQHSTSQQQQVSQRHTSQHFDCNDAQGSQHIASQQPHYHNEFNKTYELQGSQRYASQFSDVQQERSSQQYTSQQSHHYDSDQYNTHQQSLGSQFHQVDPPQTSFGSPGSMSASVVAGVCKKHGLQACVLCAMFAPKDVSPTEPTTFHHKQEQKSIGTADDPVGSCGGERERGMCAVHNVSDCLLCSLSNLSVRQSKDTPAAPYSSLTSADSAFGFKPKTRAPAIAHQEDSSHYSSSTPNHNVPLKHDDHFSGYSNQNKSHASYDMSDHIEDDPYSKYTSPQKSNRKFDVGSPLGSRGPVASPIRVREGHIQVPMGGGIVYEDEDDMAPPVTTGSHRRDHRRAPFNRERYDDIGLNTDDSGKKGHSIEGSSAPRGAPPAHSKKLTRRLPNGAVVLNKKKSQK
mmetsp:Transcript_1849/g.2931  ORF Transcript_1849/g.2931 Transcript_1849/m.2931 type:complete len:1114 (+) Transcript_1849:115-3456(+)